MSDPTQTICPECQTPRSGDNPLCDNCGYRFRRPDQEGDAPSATGRARSASSSTEFDQPPAALRRRSRGAVETAVEGVEAIPRAVARGARDDRTEVEGLRAVAPAGEPTQRQPAVGEPTQRQPAVGEPTQRQPAVVGPLSAPPTSAELIAVVPETIDPHPPTETEARGRAALWGALWLASLFGVAMLTAYQVREAASPTPDAQATAPAKPTRIAVPAGEFRRGLSERVQAFVLTTCLKMADDRSECEQKTLLAGEYPEENSTLGSYVIDSLEATVGDYSACARAGKCTAIDWKACKVYTLQGLQISLRIPRSMQEPSNAAACISHSQAEAFCAWRGGRLPTHDEWERSARGTDARVFPWGSTWDPLAANWGEVDVARMPVPGRIDGQEWAGPPGLYPGGASPIGAMDMSGNVAEWVAGSPTIARGGSWTSNPFQLRTTGRIVVDDGAARSDVGVRCAYDAAQ